MARGDDFPPLFTLAGPLGWAFGAFSIFKKVFGGSKAAEREKIFKQHRERNAARGWKPGDNMILRAATAGGEIEARRSAAERAIRQVNEWYNTLPQAPWLVRDKTAKRGALYRLRDVKENVLARNKAINDAKIKAAEKESQRQAQVRAQQRGLRDTRWNLPRRGVGIHTGGLADATGFLIDTVQRETFRRIIERDAARKRLSTATNRRGALASRGFVPSGATNRRGALATRQPTDPGAVRSARTSVRTTPQPGIESQSAPAGTVGESQTSRTARGTMSGGRTLPTQSTATTTGNPLLSLASVGVASLFTSRRDVGGAARQTTGVGSSRLSQAPLSLGQALTPLNAMGVQSASQQGCRCPEPKKKAKSSKPSCKNPVVSRTVKDGIRTTKVKLLCPQSKLK